MVNVIKDKEIKSQNYTEVQAENWLEENYPVNGESIHKSEFHDNRAKRRNEVKTMLIKNITNDVSDIMDFVGFNNLSFLYLECIGFRNSTETKKINLSDCIRLSRLKFLDRKKDLSSNEVDEVILPNDNRILEIEMYNIHLKIINYQSLNPETLTSLDFSRNDLKDDLSVFSHLVNLRSFYIDSNDFSGSFKTLRNLKKLAYMCWLDNPIIPSFEWIEGIEKIGNYHSFCCSSWEGNGDLSLASLNKLIFKNLNLLISKVASGETLTEEERFLNESWQAICHNTKFLIKYELSLKKLEFLTNCENWKEVKVGIVSENDEIIIFERKSELLNEIFFNHNNGFLKWLEDEITNIKIKTTEFYWNLILEEIKLWNENKKNEDKLTEKKFICIFEDKTF